jgi:hypothetical protein
LLADNGVFETHAVLEDEVTYEEHEIGTIVQSQSCLIFHSLVLYHFVICVGLAEAGTIAVVICFTIAAPECLRADADGAAEEGLFTLPEACRLALLVFLHPIILIYWFSSRCRTSSSKWDCRCRGFPFVKQQGIRTCTL